jgi:hypothetical protein
VWITASICITFNYDDFFDEALWRVRGLYDISAGLPEDLRYWHPDSGYGFWCKPATSLLEFDPLEMGSPTILLLKLHGSINWRVRRGYESPTLSMLLLIMKNGIPLPTLSVCGP